MNRKGFTLVELLAVIAILAILVIIALPNVIELFQNASKNSFYREVQSVYEAAKTKYISSQFGGIGKDSLYTNLITGKELSIQNGTGDFKYIVEVAANGAVKTLSVSNGSYRYTNAEIIKTAKDIEASDIEETTATVSYNGEIENVTYSYGSLNATYTSPESITTGAFVRVSEPINGVTKKYAGFKNNYQLYYIRASADSYELNQLVLLSSFDANQCTINASSTQCRAGKLAVGAYANGNVYSLCNTIYCNASPSGASCSRLE